MATYDFNIGPTNDLQTDFAPVDVGGADAGAGNTYEFKARAVAESNAPEPREGPFPAWRSQAIRRVRSASNY